MGQTYKIGERWFTPRQAAVLAHLAHGPLIVEEMTKYDLNALDKLEELDLAIIDAEEATITNAGRKVMVALNEKVNGKPAEAKPPAAETKPAKAETPATPRETKPPARETPPPQARDRLRAPESRDRRAVRGGPGGAGSPLRDRACGGGVRA